MTGPLQLTVYGDDLPPERVAEVTRELDDWIRRTTPTVRTARPAPAVPREGDKGAVEASTLLLALINAGAATALINCLATYIKERRRAVKIEVKNAEKNTSLVIDAQNLGGEDVRKLARQLAAMA